MERTRHHDTAGSPGHLEHRIVVFKQMTNGDWNTQSVKITVHQTVLAVRDITNDKSSSQNVSEF